MHRVHHVWEQAHLGSKRIPIYHRKWLKAFLAILFLSASMWTVACSSTPQPQSTPNKQEIRSDADRFFDKLGEEEKDQKPMTPQLVEPI